jgi:hypothetical protein
MSATKNPTPKPANLQHGLFMKCVKNANAMVADAKISGATAIHVICPIRDNGTEMLTLAHRAQVIQAARSKAYSGFVHKEQGTDWHLAFYRCFDRAGSSCVDNGPIDANPNDQFGATWKMDFLTRRQLGACSEPITHSLDPFLRAKLTCGGAPKSCQTSSPHNQASSPHKMVRHIYALSPTGHPYACYPLGPDL